MTLEIKKNVFAFYMKDAAIYTFEEKTFFSFSKKFSKSCNLHLLTKEHLISFRIPLKDFYNHPIKCKSIEMFFQTKQSSSKFKK